MLGPALCAAILLAWAVHGQAQIWPAVDGGAIVRHAVTGGFVEVGGPFSTWPATATGNGGATFTGAQAVKLPGARLELTLARAITPANLGRGLAIAGRLWGPIALVGLAYEGVRYLDGEWTKDDPEAPKVVDAGNCSMFNAANVVGLGGYCSGSHNGQPAVFHVYASNWYEPPPGMVGVNNCTLPTNGQGTCRVAYRYGSDVPEVPQVSATDDDLQISFQQGLISNPNKAPEVAKSLADRGLAPQLTLEPLQVIGPSSVQGPEQTTTTMSDAGTRTDHRSTVYNVTYNTNTVNITETTTTTTTFPDNSVQTTTTTTTAPQSGGDSGAGDPNEPIDVCAEHPDASGCEPLGEHDDDIELGEEQRDVQFDQELSDAGSCPTGESLSILGKSYTLEWTPLCDLASGVRPVVIALSWLSAGAFVFMVGRGTTA